MVAAVDGSWWRSVRRREVPDRVFPKLYGYAARFAIVIHRGEHSYCEIVAKHATKTTLTADLFFINLDTKHSFAHFKLKASVKTAGRPYVSHATGSRGTFNGGAVISLSTSPTKKGLINIQFSRYTRKAEFSVYSEVLIDRYVRALSASIFRKA